MPVTTDSIKELRDRSGAGIMDCKRALEAADGVIEEAEKLLAQKGLALASKKAGRTAEQGVVDFYVHAGGRLGAMIEVNCETDFVARTDQFKALAHDLAMQVAAMEPLYVRPDEVPQDSPRPAEEVALLSQAFIKDPSKSIQDLVNESIGQLRENIQVRRFTRFEIGK